MFAQDAAQVWPIIRENYAYLDRLPDVHDLPDKLRAEAAGVTDKTSLIRYAERALLVLADHHATLGWSLPDSWAVSPTHTDMWVVESEAGFVIDAVRDGSAAAQAGIARYDRITAIDAVPAEQAVAAFWADLGVADPCEARRDFAMRTLVAGRRDRMRMITIGNAAGRRDLDLPSAYSLDDPTPPWVRCDTEGHALVIRIENALGEDSTISAFDDAMARARPGQPVILDLTNTPSGGNTNIARAIMGWFVTEPHFYQMHRYPAEERATGIARQWVEQVLPRPGKYHDGPVRVRVGRWTGSMGEGLAIGMQALGATLEGQNMAGLLGAIHEFTLPHSRLCLRLPGEQLFTVDGIPRETVQVGS